MLSCVRVSACVFLSAVIKERCTKDWLARLIKDWPLAKCIKDWHLAKVIREASGMGWLSARAELCVVVLCMSDCIREIAFSSFVL